MFRLRSEQIGAFAQAQSQRLVVRLCAFLRSHFPDAEHAPEPEMKVGLARVIQKAARYGVENEQGQAVFCVAAWLLGEDFDVDHPQAQTILSSDRLSEEEKVSWLGEYTREVFARLQQD
jgi:hypothetical protein